MAHWPSVRELTRKTEIRQGGGTFGDAVLRLYEANAADANPADIGRHAAVEAAAGFVSRALEGAAVEGPSWAVPAVESWLCRAGIDLIREGETMAVMNMAGAELELMPCAWWDWNGGASESSWRVRASVFGPDGSVSFTRTRESVIWIPWTTDAQSRYAGVPATRKASLTSRLAAQAETSLGNEASGPVAQILPVPSDPAAGTDSDENQTGPTAMLRRQITAAKGKAVLAETTAAGWGEGMSAAPRRDWIAARLGPDMPLSVIEAARDGFNRTLAAFGLNPGLFSERAVGTTMRDASRLAYLNVVHPVSRRIERELRARVDPGIRLNFDLYNFDLQARAASFQKLVAGGMPLDRAAAVSGLLMPDESE